MPKLVLLLILLKIQTNFDVLGWLFGGLNSQWKSEENFLWGVCWQLAALDQSEAVQAEYNLPTLKIWDLSLERNSLWWLDCEENLMMMSLLALKYLIPVSSAFLSFHSSEDCLTVEFCYMRRWHKCGQLHIEFPIFSMVVVLTCAPLQINEHKFWCCMCHFLYSFSLKDSNYHRTLFLIIIFSKAIDQK